MDLALNNQQGLICHKTHQPTNQPTNVAMRKQQSRLGSNSGMVSSLGERKYLNSNQLRSA